VYVKQQIDREIEAQASAGVVPLEDFISTS
jgi:hypothetical protein